MNTQFFSTISDSLRVAGLTPSLSVDYKKKARPTERTTLTDHPSRLAALARVEAIIERETNRRKIASEGAAASATNAPSAGVMGQQMAAVWSQFGTLPNMGRWGY